MFDPGKWESIDTKLRDLLVENDPIWEKINKEKEHWKKVLTRIIVL